MKKKQPSGKDFLQKHKLLLIICGVCLVAVIGMIVALSLTGPKVIHKPFTPPAFDANAQTGTPEVPDESWKQVFQPGMSFVAYICGKVVLQENTADVYFTNDFENEAWLKVRITDIDGNILAETGLIKPGEYLKSVTFTTVPAPGTEIAMRIMAYEPDTYYSLGAVTLNTVVSAPQ